jgi:flagellar protein FlaG
MNPISSSPAPVVTMPTQAPKTTGSVDPAPKPKLEGVEQVASQAVQKAAPKVKADAAGEAAQAVASTTTMSGQKVQEVTQQSRDAMQVAVQQIQGYLQDSNRDMNVALDETTGYYVARVTNSQTGEVVRSIPSDETLRIARNIEMMRGMLVNQRA